MLQTYFMPLELLQYFSEFAFH